jgi:hypothetical protein
MSCDAARSTHVESRLIEIRDPGPDVFGGCLKPTRQSNAVRGIR